MTLASIPKSITNPDHLYSHGAVTFFVDPRNGRVDCDDHPARHADMLNRDDCKLGRQYLTPEQHDFVGIPLSRSKVTYYGIVAGRLALSEGLLLISIWNDLNEDAMRAAMQALVNHVTIVRDNLVRAFVSGNGYKNGTSWRSLSELGVSGSAN